MSNIDDIFKKGLDGKSSGMEYSDASWASMEQMLKTEKVGFFARYKLLLGLGGLLLVSSLTLFYFNTKNTTKNTPEVVTNSATGNTSEVETDKDLANNSSRLGLNNDISETVDALHGPTIVLESKVDRISKNQDIPASKNNNGHDENKVTSTRRAETNKNLDNNGSVKNESIALASTGHENIDSEFNAQLASTKTADNVEGFSSVSSPKTAKSKVLIKPNFGQIISAKRISVSRFEQTKNTIYSSEVELLPSPIGKKYGLYVSPYVGYVNYTKNAILPDNVTDEENNLEKSTAQFSYNYGINLGIKKGKWILSTGVGLFSLKEKTYFTATNRSYQYVTAPRISNSEFTTTPRGTRVALVTQQVVDSALIQSAEQICEGCEVSFNYVSVPLNLQYNFGSKRLRYFAEAGMTASFLQSASGVYATLEEGQFTEGPSATLVELYTSEDISKVLYQANAAVGVKYWLAPKWNLWTSYGYGMGLNSMLSSYEQKPNIQNLRVGVEFKLR